MMMFSSVVFLDSKIIKKSTKGVARFLQNNFTKVLAVLVFGGMVNVGWGQTAVILGGGASITCPATPTATYTTPPTGITFSNWSRGSSVTCGTAANGLSGSGFNTSTSGATGKTANKYYSVTISADATHPFTLSGLVWNTAVSSGSCSFAVMYSNNGGTLTQFGSNGTNTAANTFTGSVSVAPNTSIILYLVPFGTGAAGTTVRWVNGSTITLLLPTLTAATLASPLTNVYGTSSTGLGFTATGSNLSGNITATAQSGFAVSTSLGSGYTASVSVASGTTVYVQTTATKAAGTFNATAAVVLSGGGAASSVNVTTSASGNAVTQKALTITSAMATSKIYDRTTSATITGSLSGIVNSDVVTLTGTGTFAQATVGTGISVTSTSTLGGAGAGNYSLTQPTGLTADITVKALTVSAAAASNKQYDGNNTATLSGGLLVGVISPDAVTLSQSGTFGQVTIGTGISVTSTSTLGGADVANYSLTQPTGLTANITVKALTISGATASDKNYDGTTTATISGGSLVGIVSPDVVTLSESGTFSQSNAGSGLTVTSSSTLGGANAGNYSLTQPTGLTATISKATPVINSTPTASDITLGQALSSSLLTGGSATPSGGTFTFTSPSTAPGTAGAYSASITYTPTDITNYNTVLSNTTITVNAAVSPTLNAVTLSSNLTSTYGTASTGISFTPSGSNLSGNITVTAQSGYAVSTSLGSGYGSSVSVASGTTVYVQFSATLAAGSYNNAVFAVLSGGGAASSVNAITSASSNTVSPKALSISAASIASKIYDASSTSGAVTSGTLSGLVSSETLTISTATGTYSDANVGTGKTATIVYTLANGTGLAANYTLANTIATGDITAKALSISAATIASKIYNGSATSGAVTPGTLSGFVGSETVTVSAAVGTYLDANVGTGKTATLVYTLTDGTGLAANYTLANTSATGTITSKALSITLASIASKIYNASSTSGTVTPGTLSGFVGTETVTISAAVGTYLNANVGTGKVATIAYTLADGTNGGLASNYSLINTSATGDITGKAVTIVGATAQNKPYDGTTTATITGGSLVGVVSPDVVTLIQAGSFVSANVGTGIAVTSNFSISGTDAGNYTLTQPSGLSADITQAIAPLAAWEVGGLVGGPNNFGPNPLDTISANQNVLITKLTREAGIVLTSGTAAGSAWGGTGVNSTSFANAVSGNDYITFGVQAKPGYTVSFSEIPAYNIRRSGTGATTGQWQYQLNNGGFVDIGSSITWGGITNSTGNLQSSINLSTITALQNVASNVNVTFRLVVWGGSSSSGTWYINNTSGNDLQVTGTVNVYISGLPIELISFQAKCAGNNDVDITWSTASEHNSNHFVVEKSRDGVNWVILNTLGAAGNSTSVIEYAITDTDAANGTTYYRLTQFDTDGASKKFNITSVNCGEQTVTSNLVTYPNPSNGSFYIDFYSHDVTGLSSISVSDSRGLIIYRQDVLVEKGSNVFHIEDLEAAPGMYYIQVSNGTTTSYIVKHSLR